MTSKHEEYNNDVILENLKCSVQIYWAVRILAEKATKKFALRLAYLLVISYNNSFQLPFMCAEQYLCTESFAYMSYHQLL